MNDRLYINDLPEELRIAWLYTYGLMLESLLRMEQGYERMNYNEQVYYIADLPDELRLVWINRHQDVHGDVDVWTIHTWSQYTNGTLGDWTNSFKALGYTQEELDKLFFPMVYGGK